MLPYRTDQRQTCRRYKKTILSRDRNDMRTALLFFFLTGTFLISGCATVPRPVPPLPSQERTLKDVCRQYNMDCRWDGMSQTVAMNYKGKKIQAMAGSNIVIVNGDRISLSGPIVRRRGVLIVPADFDRLVVGPSAKPQEDYIKGAYTGLLKTIIVDAGHGGRDPGAIGYGGLEEKDIDLDIAKRVGKDFEAAGLKVVMTRDDDEFITLQERTALASKVGADLFVSIHSNAHKNRRSRGTEVYYSGALSDEDKSEDQRIENEKKLVAHLKMRKDIDDLKGIVVDMLYAHKLGLSPGLADAVSRTLSRDAGITARGSKPERFFVLRNTLIPAVLVEVGFITNPNEAGLLKNPEYRQRIADTVTKSILRYAYDSGL
jgi:N-acetylmuramoyl-L-alanine amidase